MNMQTTIENKLKTAFTPDFLEVANESHMHSGPATESHFKVTLVSQKFDSLSLIKQHRLVNDTLKTELNGQIHALALHTYTPDEWQKRAANAPDSPPCEGGGKSQ